MAYALVKPDQQAYSKFPVGGNEAQCALLIMKFAKVMQFNRQCPVLFLKDPEIRPFSFSEIFDPLNG